MLAAPILGLLLAACAFMTSAAAAGSAAERPFADPLDTPARLSPRAVISPMFALARVDDDHVVAVGPRGLVLRSADRGRSWAQQATPVGTDLLAVQFPTPQLGFAVGHDGVVLRSTDGGSSWQRVLDGRSLNKLLVAWYEKRAASGDADASRLLDEAKRMAEDGPTRPFLSLHFRNEREGWLVGQFNLILHTRDGGTTWEPWLERTENPDAYSLHTIRAAGDDVVIAGELGLVLRLDAAAGRFRRVETPYQGSWFGLVASRDTWVAVGLRGSAWRSTDHGASWKALATGTTAAINGGVFLDERRFVLVTQQGQILLSADLGETFAVLPPPAGLPSAFDVISVEPGWLLVSGPGGVARITIPSMDK